MRSAADLGVPMVGVTLASRAGYFRQEIQEGTQVERAEHWDPALRCRRLPIKVVVRVGSRDVWLGAWQYDVPSARRAQMGVPVILLDTDLPENNEEDRTLTHWLYGGDSTYRLRQEIVLAIMGGVFVLEVLSVMVQVSWFKYTKRRYGEGRRVLLMAPLHHHFEKAGWKETQVVVRFWIITMLLCLVGLSSLKLR